MLQQLLEDRFALKLATTLDDFAQRTLNGAVDRPVVNKTDITGRFDIHLEYARDDNAIFSALQQQLGLKLQAAKGRGEFLVIDHAEKSAAN